MKQAQTDSKHLLSKWEHTAWLNLCSQLYKQGAVTKADLSAPGRAA